MSRPSVVLALVTAALLVTLGAPLIPGFGMSGSATTQLTANIKEYDVPTPNSFPHDPAVAPDGSLWWTGMQANRLGRLDTTTGKMREFRVTTGSSPHGLVADKAGDIWFTAIGGGYIGRLNPTTGRVTEYKMPDPEATGPHTPVFDQSGVLWFTLEESDFVGRLDPRTGKVQLVHLPTAKAIPYGIVVSSAGVPWFSEFGTNKLGSIDPNTMKVTEHELPKGARPRRLAITSDDIIYYSDFARGYLGRFDTHAGEQKQWPSPSGDNAEPYAIAITPDGNVWYVETGVKPNQLVRFDPRTQQFSSKPIPSGGGVVRNIAVTKDGRLYLACSGVNKVAVVQP